MANDPSSNLYIIPNWVNSQIKHTDMDREEGSSIKMFEIDFDRVHTLEDVINILKGIQITFSGNYLEDAPELIPYSKEMTDWEDDDYDDEEDDEFLDDYDEDGEL